MRTIWKFALETIDTQQISMPIGAQILALQVQFDVPCIWALIDLSAPEEVEERTFEIYGTGADIPEDSFKRKFVGTYQLAEGQFVGHVFEVIK